MKLNLFAMIKAGLKNAITSAWSEAWEEIYAETNEHVIEATATRITHEPVPVVGNGNGRRKAVKP